MNALPPTTEMERALLTRDAAYDGLFFIGVRTTGIFCRPTCPARKPRLKNVEYFRNAEAAGAAGYRPCKRCRPLELDDQPKWATELLAELARDPATRITDAALKARGIDPTTARRYFRRRYGMTFQAYARARRLSGSLGELREQGLGSAVFESGYDSHSGFRDAFGRIFNSTPGKYGDRECVLVSRLRTPLGPMIAGATKEGVCLLEFGDREILGTQLDRLRDHFRSEIVPGTNRHLETLEVELEDYFAGSLTRFTVPLVYPGTEFQRAVWSELLAIPYGETRSYEELAAAIGKPKAVRAVGRTNGLNRLAILIPCHRVVNKSGALGGYGGGLRRKQYLLDLERTGSDRLTLF